MTFAPSGEPLLDANLGREVRGIREMTGARVAVITNSSLLFLEDARADLAEADVVSLKVDAVGEAAWRAVNRPHGSLGLDEVLEGVLEFSRLYGGVLLTETMLVAGLNDSEEELGRVASLLSKLGPRKAYVGAPVRPPAEPWARPPSPDRLLRAYELLSMALGPGRVELLGPGGPPRARARGDPVPWLLATASAHPLRLEEAVEALSGLVEDPEALIRGLVERGELELVGFQGSAFLVRRRPRAP